MIQEKREELLNTLTHGIGFVLAIVAFVLLLIRYNELQQFNYIAIFTFGISMMLLYAASTLYHAFSFSKHKKTFKKIDHLAIYILIAGTYTPILALGLKGFLGTLFLAIIWSLVVLGFVFKFSKFQYNKKISLAIYLGMGWIVIFAIKPLIEALSTSLLLFILYGGLAYTIGAVFYANKKIPYHHAIWHVFVLMGTAFHFLGIYLYL